MLFQLGWPFRDADEFHSEANKQKMSSGVPLTDEVRIIQAYRCKSNFGNSLPYGSVTCDNAACLQNCSVFCVYQCNVEQ